MMQVAEVLSDLTSLKACEPNAALALVSARPHGHSEVGNTTTTTVKGSDPDLQRAKDLLELHATVKVAHQDGTDKELNDARKAVEDVLRTLER